MLPKLIFMAYQELVCLERRMRRDEKFSIKGRIRIKFITKIIIFL